MVRLHSSFFRAENAQIIILFEIPGKRVFKKDPSTNKVLREVKEDIEDLTYDVDKILWYSKIWTRKKKRGQTDVTEKP